MKWKPGDPRRDIDSMIRVDQAGEYGATRIYAGQLADALSPANFPLTNPQVLARAGAKDADMIIAVTNSDETNMIACQIAYTLFHTPTKIARVRARAKRAGTDRACASHAGRIYTLGAGADSRCHISREGTQAVIRLINGLSASWPEARP